ncbi:gluconolaconase [Xenophilus sp. AP218F]|nr:SMP-30/gluconolactonase/LRE family protein [Chromobacterium sp. ASV5]OWY40042.1 gluconolaconase [Xenophilus sp. AP218F]
MSVCRVVSRSRAALGECVLWDDRTGLLWWTDILGRRLWRWDSQTGGERFWPLPARLACFALTKRQDTLLLGLEKKLALFDCASGEVRGLVEIEPGSPFTRVNDGRCDRSGNFVFGTMNERGEAAIGGWYRYSVDGSLQKLALPACSIANSICFSPDGGTLYFADSPSGKIFCCDYQPSSGGVSNIRLFHDLANRYLSGKTPNPDGSIIDAQGGLWNAEWGGASIARYLPDGQLDRSLALPVTQPTCLAFGGPALDVLYLSSAHVGLGRSWTGHELEGRVMALRDTGLSGLREARFGEAWTR